MLKTVAVCAQVELVQSVRINGTVQFFASRSVPLKHLLICTWSEISNEHLYPGTSSSKKLLSYLEFYFSILLSFIIQLLARFSSPMPSVRTLAGTVMRWTP